MNKAAVAFVLWIVVLVGALSGFNLLLRNEIQWQTNLLAALVLPVWVLVRAVFHGNENAGFVIDSVAFGSLYYLFELSVLDWHSPLFSMFFGVFLAVSYNDGKGIDSADAKKGNSTNGPPAKLQEQEIVPKPDDKSE